jgi:hypothetical protein
MLIDPTSIARNNVTVEYSHRSSGSESAQLARRLSTRAPTAGPRGPLSQRAASSHSPDSRSLTSILVPAFRLLTVPLHANKAPTAQANFRKHHLVLRPFQAGVTLSCARLLRREKDGAWLGSYRPMQWRNMYI